MDRDMDTAAIYEVAQDDGKHVICPVLATDGLSRTLAYEWASSLARVSGQKVTIYRNGAKQIDIPAQQ